MDAPSTNGPGWRDVSGRFVKGNPGGPGNPHAPQVARLRAAMLEAVTEDQVRAVIGKLVELAEGGSVPAAREVRDRCLGKGVEAVDLMERLEKLEGVLGLEERKAG